MIRKAIAEAVNAGTPVASMRESIQAAFAERRADWQLDRIARTETHQAQEAGGWLAAKQNQIEFKRWVSSRDGKVRGNDPDDEADHVTLDLLPRWPMNEPWIDPRNQGRLLFPGDSSAPAACVINCRCTWISDFSHLKNWTPPEPEYVWLRKAARQRDFQKVLRGFFNKQIQGMEERALAVFDAQAQIAA